jgi:membrane peptidoglycan carboxypeptidase
VPRTDPVLPRLGLGLAVSALCGVLLAGLALPVVGGAGLLAKQQADEFLALPAELEQPTLATRSRVLAADGSVLATLFLENRLPATLAEIPELTRSALIAMEDSRFYDHDGVDYKGTVRAALKNATAGGVTQGGSTLTQQYVKNVLVELADTREGQLAAKEVSVDRKMREARYALALERRMSKDQILEAYFNIAYYGNGVYGIKTAASHYLGKRVQDLTLAEGAMFAGMVKDPNGLDPSDEKAQPAVLARRSAVLQRMTDLGMITPAERAAADREPIAIDLKRVRPGCENPQVKAPFFCDYVRRYLEDDTEVGRLLGATREERQRRLLGGGLTIRTSLDPKVQAAAQAAVDGRVPRTDRSRVVAVADVVEPGTGLVKAMAVNRVFGDDERRPEQTKVNFAIGGSSGMQPGSTMKTFVLAQALRDGLPVGLRLNSPATYCPVAFEYRLADGGCPGNAGDSEAGVFDMVSGTHHSVNTYYLQLEERTGLATPPALAEAMGLRQFEGGKPQGDIPRVPSFVLGTAQVSPLDMAAAYATFAARGVHCPPRPVTAILDARGRELPLPPQDCRRVLEQGVADTVTSILRGVIDGPTRGRTGAAAAIGRPAAGKTGTTNSSRAAWFVGYTPELSTAVWLGMKEPTPMRDIRIGGRYYRQVYGGSLPAPIWKDVMAASLAGSPVRGFPGADLAVSRGELVTVPDVRGLPFETARAQLTEAGFGVRNGGPVAAAPVPAGSVASSSPAAGSSVRAGALVTLFVSDGQVPVATPAPQPTSGGGGPQPTTAPTSSPTPVPERTKKARPGGGGG